MIWKGVSCGDGWVDGEDAARAEGCRDVGEAERWEFSVGEGAQREVGVADDEFGGDVGDDAVRRSRGSRRRREGRR